MDKVVKSNVRKSPAIGFCILMDLLGMSTYLLPGAGEWFDILWAPISAYIFYRSFGGKTGRIGSFINLLEELTPFTDIIPTFTLAWIYEKLRKRFKKI